MSFASIYPEYGVRRYPFKDVYDVILLALRDAPLRSGQFQHETTSNGVLAAFIVLITVFYRTIEEDQQVEVCLVKYSLECMHGRHAARYKSMSIL